MKISDATKYLYAKRLTSIYDGNVSFRKAKSTSFVITPSGFRKHELRENEMITVFFENEELVYKGNPSQEIDLHYNILKNLNLEEELYVVHCHPQNILSFIHDEQELSDILLEYPEINYKIGKNVKYFKAGSKDLADSTYLNIINNDIVALEQHGIVCISNDLRKCLDIVEIIDYYCEISNKTKTKFSIHSWFKSIFMK